MKHARFAGAFVLWSERGAENGPGSADFPARGGSGACAVRRPLDCARGRRADFRAGRRGAAPLRHQLHRLQAKADRLHLGISGDTHNRASQEHPLLASLLLGEGWALRSARPQISGDSI